MLPNDFVFPILNFDDENAEKSLESKSNLLDSEIAIEQSFFPKRDLKYDFKKYQT